MQDDDRKKESAASKAVFDLAKPGGIGAYAGGGYSPSGSNPWAKDIAHHKRKSWSDTSQGRLAIRLVSRGILGCAFFAFGQIKAHDDMIGYDKKRSFKESWRGYEDPDDVALGKANPKIRGQNVLQLLARLIDITAGTAIKTTVSAVGGDGDRAVTFRPTRSYRYDVYGRSLGHEVVGITFDFAMASVGDALGRNLAALVDPNAKKKWLKDGRLDLPEALKSLIKSTWKIFSYNQMEDWAVAIPYAYQMKAQRSFINHFSPGFEFDSDRALNGGSFKVDDKGKIVGNYQVEGMVDLGLRFTGYNVGTMIFRETYDKLGRTFSHWWKTGKVPELNMPKSPVGLVSAAIKTTSDFARYIVKSTIKASIYMLPATFFFWGTRTPQSKDIGIAIYPKGRLSWEEKGRGQTSKYGPLWFQQRDADGQPMLSPKMKKVVKAHIIANGMHHSEVQKYYSDDARIGAELKFNNGELSPNHPFQPQTDAYGQRYGFNPYDVVTNPLDRVTNPIGQFISSTNTVVEQGLNALAAKQAKMRGLSGDEAKAHERYVGRFSRAYTYGAYSYTPYMYMKGELANQWDNKRADIAINRTLNAAGNLNWNEFKVGIGEIKRAMLHQPFADSDREKRAQYEMWSDSVPADDAIPLAYRNGNGNGNIHGHHQGKRFVTDELRNSLSEGPAAWVAKEAARQLAKEQNAPTTHSIN